MNLLSFSVKNYMITLLFILNYVIIYTEKKQARFLIMRYRARQRYRRLRRNLFHFLVFGVACLVVFLCLCGAFRVERKIELNRAPSVKDIEPVVELDSSAELVIEPTIVPDSFDSDSESVFSLTASAEGLAVPTIGSLSTSEPAVIRTPVPTSEPVTAYSASMEYLPVIRKADVGDRKVVAVTVDDCFQVSNLESICRLAIENGQKLTLFPIGKNLEKKKMPEIIRVCHNDYGFEIENHTWSHAKIYKLSDEDMTSEIWKAQSKIGEILGGDYQCHFLRLMGGQGDHDQRTHVYLTQLGYKGIAKWAYSGSDADLKHIKQHTKPGTVFLFHTTNRDTEILKTFLPWLKEQGYELVTLNKLFGYPENELTSYSGESKPVLAEYQMNGLTCKSGEYSWLVYQIQEKLISLKYLKIKGSPTGYYGDQTVTAIKYFQKDKGLKVTGEADAVTQQALFDLNI